MANKTVFTEFDVYNFEKALALHAAKWNALYKKYSDLLNLAEKDRFKEKLTSFSDETKDEQIRLLQMILADIETPCDLFISQFELAEVRG